MAYTDKVIEHYKNPRNVGSMIYMQQAFEESTSVLIRSIPKSFVILPVMIHSIV